LIPDDKNVPDSLNRKVLGRVVPGQPVSGYDIFRPGRIEANEFRLRCCLVKSLYDHVAALQGVIVFIRDPCRVKGLARDIGVDLCQVFREAYDLFFSDLFQNVLLAIKVRGLDDVKINDLEIFEP